MRVKNCRNKVMKQSNKCNKWKSRERRVKNSRNRVITTTKYVIVISLWFVIVVLVEGMEAVALGLHADVDPRRVAQAQLESPHGLLL